MMIQLQVLRIGCFATIAACAIAVLSLLFVAPWKQNLYRRYSKADKVTSLVVQHLQRKV